MLSASMCHIWPWLLTLKAELNGNMQNLCFTRTQHLTIITSDFNQSHLSAHLSFLHFLHPSLLHSFTLNSKLTFSVNPSHHRSLTIDNPDWLPLLMWAFSISTLLSCFKSWFGTADQTSFSVHTKLDNFIVINQSLWHCAPLCLRLSVG